MVIPQRERVRERESFALLLWQVSSSCQSSCFSSWLFLFTGGTGVWDGAVWAMMGLHVCMCVRTGGSYSLCSALRRKQPQPLIDCNQLIYVLQDLFLQCHHTPAIWMWCQSVVDITSTDLYYSLNLFSLCI